MRNEHLDLAERYATSSFV